MPSSAMDNSVLPTEEIPPRTAADLNLPEEDERWKLAVRIAESSYFANSRLLARLLLFICECTLLHRVDELTERNLGVVVFQRRPGYKTTEDNIVRTYIRQLRQRLDLYFEEYGDAEPLRIVIPKGGYVARFEERVTDVSADETKLPVRLLTVPVRSALEQAEDAVAEVREDVGRRFAWKLPLAMLGLGAILGAIGLFVANRYFRPASPAHALWVELFSPTVPTDIVTADSALATLEEFSGTRPSLQHYVDGSYFSQFEKKDTEDQRRIERLSHERLTGFPDVSMVSELLTLPEARDTRVRVRSARSFNMDEMSDANVVLMGSPDSTPWVSLFDAHMNFRYVFDQSVYSSYYANTKPLAGEQADYRNQSTAPPYATYAVIAYLPNPKSSGNVLLVGGLTTAGTEAAASFLTRAEMGTFLKTVPRDGGVLRPFELLLKTTDVESSSASVEIVAKRIY